MPLFEAWLMGEHNFTKQEKQNKKADCDGQINKNGSLLAPYDADKSGKKGRHSASSRKKYRDCEHKITEECVAAPLPRSHKEEERSEKQKETGNQSSRPST